MKTNLFPTWRCTKCGKEHYEMTDHCICADAKACSTRILENRHKADKQVIVFGSMVNSKRVH